MDNIKIRKITSPSEELLNTTTKWMYEWWGIENGYKYEDVYTYMKNSYNKDKLPQTYIMYLNDKAIGMFQITYRDLFIRPDVYPWIANIYIDKEYRKKGYGKILISSINNIIQNDLSFNTIYLYTSHINLYEQYGWELIENLDENNRLYKLNIR